MASPDTKTLTIALLAGEMSGDNLGAPLIRELKKVIPDARFVGIGGPLMIAEGLESWFDIDRLSVNGFIDPIRRLPELLNIFLTIRSRLISSPPTCFVGIDFNFFNLLLDGQLKKHGIKTVHYVSPTVWAWRSGRMKGIARNVDLMLTLYPFETAIYEEHGVGVRFVGHPKAHEIAANEDSDAKPKARLLFGCDDQDEIVALLPGSRSSEVGFSAPDFFAAAEMIAREKPRCKFIVPAANHKRKLQINQLIEDLSLPIDIQVVEGQSKEVMTAADVVLVNSGTATLEAMLLKRPMVMSYRLGALTYYVVSKLVKTKYFALPNILAGRQLVPELMQDEATPEALATAILALFDPEVQRDLAISFDAIHRNLQKNSGSEAADAILELCGVTSV